MNRPPRATRTPILYTTLGFAVGVIISRNAAPMRAPSKGAVIIGIILMGWLLWRAANRGRNEAIATAVAIATANATANAEAHASAVAQQAVAVYIGNQRDENFLDYEVKSVDWDADSSSISEHATTEEIEDDAPVRNPTDNRKRTRKPVPLAEVER